MGQNPARRSTRLSVVLTLTLALVACGGGDEAGDGSAPDRGQTAEAPASAAGWRDAAREAAYDEFDELCADQFTDAIVERFARFTGTELTRAEMIAPADHQDFSCEYQAADLQILEVVVDRDDAPTCERLMSADEEDYSSERDLYLSEQVSEGTIFRRLYACLDATSIAVTVSSPAAAPAFELLEDEEFAAELTDDLRGSFDEWEADAEQARRTTAEQR